MALGQRDHAHDRAHAHALILDPAPSLSSNTLHIVQHSIPASLITNLLSTFIITMPKKITESAAVETPSAADNDPAWLQGATEATLLLAKVSSRTRKPLASRADVDIDAQVHSIEELRVGCLVVFKVGDKLCWAWACERCQKMRQHCEKDPKKGTGCVGCGCSPCNAGGHSEF